MKFKDSLNWGHTKKFYEVEAVDLISTLICVKSTQINHIYIHYVDGKEECADATTALNFLANKELKDLKTIIIYGTDNTFCAINVYTDYMEKDYAEFEYGKYWQE